MRPIYTAIWLVLFSLEANSQICQSNFIPDSLIEVEGGAPRSGSCASPDGTVSIIAGYPPDYAYLSNNGYCQAVSPVTKDVTVCYTFTSPGTSVELNAGYSASGCAGIAFNNFKLYTCAPSCTVVGTGLTFTGLTAGTCYTWCFHAKCTGPGPGFDFICPYYLNTTVLSIELNYFEGVQYGNTNFLSWETLSELNNNEFEILRSTDGSNYESIASIHGSGTTSEKHNYYYSDVTPFTGSNYYILKQTDFDGTSSQSSPIIINHLAEETTQIQIDPNPVDNTLSATVNSGKIDMNGEVQITDITGRIYYSQTIYITDYSTPFSLDVSDFPVGFYIITVQTSAGRVQGNFIK